MPLKLNFPNHASGCHNKIQSAKNEVIDLRDVQQDPLADSILKDTDRLLGGALANIALIQDDKTTLWTVLRARMTRHQEEALLLKGEFLKTIKKVMKEEIRASKIYTSDLATDTISVIHEEEYVLLCGIAEDGEAYLYDDNSGCIESAPLDGLSATELYEITAYLRTIGRRIAEGAVTVAEDGTAEEA